MKVGESIVIVDARGCWTVHTVTDWDRIDGPHFSMGNAVWKRLVFFATGTRTRVGKAIYRATEPAIGKPETPYSPLFLPEGWNPPSLAIEVAA